MREFVEAYGVDIVGGCCGTTPEHTRVLVEALRGVRPARRAAQGGSPV
jgi:5-methyltetrahydrofolate--homocysteine methyltransferase